MSRTKRWWNHSNKTRKLKAYHLEQLEDDGYGAFNPFYGKHELKIIRVKIHRAVRRLNKVNLQKGREIEPETKTCGWMIY